MQNKQTETKEAVFPFQLYIIPNLCSSYIYWMIFVYGLASAFGALVWDAARAASKRAAQQWARAARPRAGIARALSRFLHTSHMQHPNLVLKTFKCNTYNIQKKID